MSKTARKVLIGVGILAALLIIFAIVLDPVATWAVNYALNGADGVLGHVDSVHVGLIAGDGEARGIHVEQEKDSTWYELTNVNAVKVRIDRASLFRGVVNVGMRVDKPQVTLWRPILDTPEMKEKAKEAAEMVKPQRAPNIQATLRKIFPFKVDHLEVRSGELIYRDPTTTPKVEEHVTNIDVDAVNLTNRDQLKDARYANIKAKATPLADGVLTLDLSVDPLQKQPAFALQMEVKNLQLGRMNDLLRAYSQFEVAGGEIAIFAEYDAKDGKFDGYVKPLVTHLEVHPWDKADLNAIEKFWRQVVGVAVGLFKNQRHEQVATKVPMHGTFDTPDIDILEAVLAVLKNAFISAIMPTLDHDVTIAKQQ